MSRTMTDDALVSELRERTDASLPPMRLHPDDVLAAARRRKRRVRALQSAGAAVVVAAVGIGVASGLPGGETRTDPPATSDATIVEVAPGVRAAATPVPITLADGTEALLLGLRAANQAEGELAIVANDGSNAPDPVLGLGTAWASRDAAIDLALVGNDRLLERAYWEGWTTPGRLTDTERAYWGEVDGTDPFSPIALGAPTDLAPDEAFAIGIFYDDDTFVLAGLAPADADPTALAEVTLRHPILGADGEPTTRLLLPTFAAPTGDGRRMFVATLDASLDLPRPSDPFTSDLPLERVPVPMVGAGTGTLEIFMATEVEEYYLAPEGRVLVDLGLEEVAPLVAGVPGEVARLVLAPTGAPFTGESVQTEPTSPYTSDFVPHSTVELRARSPRGLGEPILEFGWPMDPESINDFERWSAAWSIGSADGVFFVTGAMPADATDATVTVGESRLGLPTFTTPSLKGGAIYVIAVRLTDRGPNPEPLMVSVQYTDKNGNASGISQALAP